MGYQDETTRAVHSMFSGEERAAISEATLERLSPSYAEVQRRARRLIWYLERQRENKTGRTGSQE